MPQLVLVLQDVVVDKLRRFVATVHQRVNAHTWWIELAAKLVIDSELEAEIDCLMLSLRKHQLQPTPQRLPLMLIGLPQRLPLIRVSSRNQAPPVEEEPVEADSVG